MSSMQISDTIQKEIEDITTAQKAMVSKKIELRTFILSGEAFLVDHGKFDKLISEWSDTLMTLWEAVGKSFQIEGMMGINNPNPLSTANGFNYSKVEDGELTATKAAVIIAGLATGVLVVYLLPSVWAVGVLIAAGAVIGPYFNKIADYIKGEPKKPNSPNLNILNGQISESISAMRDRHVKACFRLKFKNPDPNRSARHDPGEAKSLYDYKQLILETLPRWCMNRLDDITVKCDGVAFGRKTVLLEYLHAASNRKGQVQGKDN